MKSELESMECFSSYLVYVEKKCLGLIVPIEDKTLKKFTNLNQLFIPIYINTSVYPGVNGNDIKVGLANENSLNQLVKEIELISKVFNKNGIFSAEYSSCYSIEIQEVEITIDLIES